jgi:hypothetical protein
MRSNVGGQPSRCNFRRGRRIGVSATADSSSEAASLERRQSCSEACPKKMPTRARRGPKLGEGTTGPNGGAELRKSIWQENKPAPPQPDGADMGVSCPVADRCASSLGCASVKERRTALSRDQPRLSCIARQAVRSGEPRAIDTCPRLLAGWHAKRQACAAQSGKPLEEHCTAPVLRRRSLSRRKPR